jgi:decaprenyl-phosphate phosphoribosyltransferase
MQARSNAWLESPREENPVTADASAHPKALPGFQGYIRIARLDHWIKTLFVLPGIAAALALNHYPFTSRILVKMVLGLMAASLIASSNYVLNEVLDAPYDRFHPLKCHRPVPSGQVSVPLAYLEWLGLGGIGLAIAIRISLPFMLSLLALWVMGCIYNVRPFRSKDIPYLDVLSEAANNPIRMFAGWFIVSASTIPPLSLLVSYWMAGCYFMALKRYAELLHFRSDKRLQQYRSSLAQFTPESLMVSVVFYGCASMLFFGAFLMRYRFELVLSFPLIALVMAIYLSLAFKPESAVEHPEKLYREPKLMLAVLACVVVMAICLSVDMPKLYTTFRPTAPVSRAYDWLQYEIYRR